MLDTQPPGNRHLPMSGWWCTPQTQDTASRNEALRVAYIQAGMHVSKEQHGTPFDAFAGSSTHARPSARSRPHHPQRSAPPRGEPPQCTSPKTPARLKSVSISRYLESVSISHYWVGGQERVTLMMQVRRNEKHRVLGDTCTFGIGVTQSFLSGWSGEGDSDDTGGMK